MTDKAFLDSNILIYLYSEDEPQKQSIAEGIFDNSECIISTQTLNEFCNVCTKKLKKPISEVIEALNKIKEYSILKFIDDKIIEQALFLHDKYFYSYFDSLMLSSALKSSCDIIYSEDMQHRQVIEKSLIIINPFVN